MAETTGYCQGGPRDMKSIAEMQGVKPVDIERFCVGDTDMTSQLDKLNAAGVDTVIIWARGTPIAQIMRSMQKVNYYPRTLSPRGQLTTSLSMMLLVRPWPRGPFSNTDAKSRMRLNSHSAEGHSTYKPRQRHCQARLRGHWLRRGDWVGAKVKNEAVGILQAAGFGVARDA